MTWTSKRLTTDRLTLRPFADDDTETVVLMFTDDETRRFLGGPADLPDGFSASTITDQWGAWCIALSDTDNAIGYCTFDRERGSLELSYSLIPDTWGNGYTTEACAAVIEWVWSDTEDSFIIVVTQTANEGSMRLLSRLGFSEEHRFEEHGTEQSMQYLRRPV